MTPDELDAVLADRPDLNPFEEALIAALREAWADSAVPPRTETEAITCPHGNRVWFGHECGLCEDDYDRYGYGGDWPEVSSAPEPENEPVEER